MKKEFNVNGDCKPDIHYMVDISEQLHLIKEMIDTGKYFTIHRARQYGKTTTLNSLEVFLKKEKTIGVKEIRIGDKTLVEAVV